MAGQLDSSLVRTVPYHFARAKGLIAARRLGDVVELWVRPGVTAAAISEARRALGAPVKAVMLAPELFERRLAQLYTRDARGAAELIDDLSEQIDLKSLAEGMPEVTDLLETEDDAPVIRFINVLLTQALRERASDVHLEAFEGRSLVRFRIDGTLRDVLEPPRALHAALVSRIKVMASLDIAEKRLPQDGRITLRIAGRPVDVRVSTLPTGHGERVVLRLLDKQQGVLELGALGMSDPTRDKVGELIGQAHGIVLVTGPTGSGKTTTLYAALSKLDAGKLNIMTVEDPIEYDLDGIGQTQVNPAIEMTFARALRAILRQDPDVVMIGEIRDLETARIAVQASLTGHLVLATLHTNDAVGAVTRLIDMGSRAVPARVEPAWRARAAARAQALSGLPQVRLALRGGSCGDAAALARAPHLYRRRLRALQVDRICRPQRHLRAPRGRRRDAPAHPRRCRGERNSRTGARSRDDDAPRRRLALGASPARARSRRSCASRARPTRSSRAELAALGRSHVRLPL